MATAEAIDFLIYLRQSGQCEACVAHGRQWTQWARAEGFDPDEVLEGLGALEGGSGLDRAFLGYLLEPDRQDSSLRSWLESIVDGFASSQANVLLNVSGGAKSKDQPSKQAQFTAKIQHMSAELLELKTDFNEELLELKTDFNEKLPDLKAKLNEHVTVDHEINYSSNEHYTEITFSTAKISNGNARVNKDYYGWEINGSMIGPKGDYQGISGELYSSNPWNSYLSIGKYHFSGYEVKKKDSALLERAARVENRAMDTADALKDVWTTDLDPWTQQQIIQSKKWRHFKRHHLGSLERDKSFLTKAGQFDYRSLDHLQKVEVYSVDRVATYKVEHDQALRDSLKSAKDQARSEYRTVDTDVDTTIENIETLQREYSAYKHDYKIAKDPLNTYFNLFARLRGNSDDPKNYNRLHYATYDPKVAMEKVKKFNPDQAVTVQTAENEEAWVTRTGETVEVRAAFASKREQLFAKSEARAVKAASVTYQEALKSGNPKQVCLAMATATYLQTLVQEDLDFLREKPDQARAKWNSLSKRTRERIEILAFYQPRLRMLLEHDMEIVGDVLLSVGADLLRRQVDVAEKAYHDQQKPLSVLRLELLVSRLTLEFSMAERYENWCNLHPVEVAHPFNSWIAGAWRDIWDTLTLPYRAVKAEVKAWKTGAGFWAGLKAGWDTEGKIFHQDLRGINHTVKHLERILAPIFSWIPGIRKVVDAVNLIGRAIESIPFHIAKNVTSLGRQLYKVVTGQSTWKGIYKALGRDTRGIRHLIRHFDWLMHDIFTGNFKNIGEVVSKDFNEAKRGVKIYVDRKEIMDAIKIKHHEITIRHKLHKNKHLRHIVKSPLRIFGADAIYNLTNDKAFVTFRQTFAATAEGKVYLRMSSLYGSGVLKTTRLKLDKRLKALKTNFHKLTSLIESDLKAQFSHLTKMQKAAYFSDYKHNDFPWNRILHYEISTTVVQNHSKKLLKIERRVTSLPSDVGKALSLFESLMQQTLTTFSNYFTSKQSSMQKRAQSWAMKGGLLKWATNVDRSFIENTMRVAKFMRSPKGPIVEERALDAYLIYKHLHPLKQEILKKQEHLHSLIESNTVVVDTRKAYHQARNDYKTYHKKQAYFTRQWNKWGKADGKKALVAYDLTFGVSFTINSATTPPTVTCSALTAKESKAANSKITGHHIGERFFMRLMWTQYVSQAIAANPLGKLKTDLSIGESLTHSVQKRADRLIAMIRVDKPLQAVTNKTSTFFASHIILKDLIMIEDGNKIRAIRRNVGQKLERLDLKLAKISELVKKVHAMVPVAQERVNKALRRETDFVKLLNIQVSELNKTNYKIFESQSFNNIKLLKLQAAVAYDFGLQPDGKKTLPSRYQDMKTRAAKKNKTLAADYSADKTTEQGGADLTIGQALKSFEVAPSPAPTSLKQHWSALMASSSFAFGGGGSGGGKEPDPNPSPNPTPNPTPPTANLLLLYRNYKLIKHLVTPKKKGISFDDLMKSEADKLDFDSLTSDSIGADVRAANRKAVRLEDGDGLEAANRKLNRQALRLEDDVAGLDGGEIDFDTLTNGSIESAITTGNRQAVALEDDVFDRVTRSVNREAIRLEDDLALFKDEVETDELIVQNDVATATKDAVKTVEDQTESDLVSEVDSLDADLPDGKRLLNANSEINEFTNTVIETASSDASTLISTEVKAEKVAVDEEVDADIAAADEVGADAAALLP